jgi:hypothetical protein
MVFRLARPIFSTNKNGSYTISVNGKTTQSSENKNPANLSSLEKFNNRFNNQRYYSGSQNSFNPTDIVDSSDPGFNNIGEASGCFYTAMVKQISYSDVDAIVRYSYSSLPGRSTVVLTNTKFLIPGTYVSDLNIENDNDLYIDVNKYSYCVRTETPGVGIEYHCTEGPQNDEFGWTYSFNDIVGGPYASGTNCEDLCGLGVEDHKFGYCEAFDPLADGIYAVVALNRDQYPLHRQDEENGDIPLLPITYPSKSIEPFIILVTDGIIRYKIPLNVSLIGYQSCFVYDDAQQGCTYLLYYQIKILHHMLVGFATSNSWMTQEERSSYTTLNVNINFGEMTEILKACGVATFNNLLSSETICDDYCYYPFNTITYQGLNSPNQNPSKLCDTDCWPYGYPVLSQCQTVTNEAKSKGLDPSPCNDGILYST